MGAILLYGTYTKINSLSSNSPAFTPLAVNETELYKSVVSTESVGGTFYSIPLSKFEITIPGDSTYTTFEDYFSKKENKKTIAREVVSFEAYDANAETNDSMWGGKYTVDIAYFSSDIDTISSANEYFSVDSTKSYGVNLWSCTKEFDTEGESSPEKLCVLVNKDKSYYYMKIKSNGTYDVKEIDQVLSSFKLLS